MSLLSRLLPKTPPAAPLTLEGRIAALDTATPQSLLDTARVDTAGGAADPQAQALAEAARARLAALVDAGALDFGALCASTLDRDVLLAVALLCRDPGRLPQALAAITDPAQLDLLIVDGATSRLRQLAADTVDDPARLRRLLPQVRTKDKTVYKILKARADAWNAEQRHAAQLAAEIEARCAALERHSQRSFDSFYAATFERLAAEWRNQTPPPGGDTEERACRAIAHCSNVIAVQLRDIEEQAARRAAEQAERAARERAALAARTAAAAQAEAEARARSEAEAARLAEEAAHAAQRAAEEQKWRQLGGLIGRTHSALAQGNTQQAAGLRRAIADKWPSDPAVAATAVPPHLVRQLQELDGKLDDLKQWKDYAVAPKRAALIVEMEALVGSTDDPPALAERIKALQEEWRTISKGIAIDTSAEWERFHRASQSAYAPCRAYFEAQAERRTANLQQRKALVERVTAVDTAQAADGADFRLLAQVLREAPLEWRNYFPVDRAANRPVEQAFDAALGRLKSRLDAFHERNASEKQALIQRARQQLTLPDGREAILGIKRLQAQWKETGPAPREQESSLWSEFRAVCDAAFQRREQTLAKHAASLQAARAAVVALCEEAERAAQLTGGALLEASAAIPAWRAALESHAELPRADARDLRERFERAVNACRASVARQQAEAAQQALSTLFEAGRHIRAYERAVLAGSEPAVREELQRAAQEILARDVRWPKGGLAALRDTLAKADTLRGSDGAARERALRLLCIRAEIRTQQPTPPEDESLRREYQVQRLMKSMGQGAQADEFDWATLTLDWIRLGASTPEAQEALQARFDRCLATRPPPGTAHVG